MYLKANVLPKKVGNKYVFLVYYRSQDGKIVERMEEVKNNIKLQNISKLQQYFIETRTTPFQLYNENFEPERELSSNEFERMKKIYYDIEAFNPERIPFPKIDPIISIATLSNKPKVFVNSDLERVEEGEILIKYEDERRILIDLLNELFGNDLAIGYNSFAFDNPYIQERARVLGLKDFKFPISYTPTRLFERKKIAIFPGIINVDLLPLIRFFNFPSSSFDFLSKIWKFERKVGKVEDLYKFFLRKEYWEIISHNLEDVELTRIIFEKLRNFIWHLGNMGIGTLEYVIASFHSLPRLLIIREISEFLREKGYKTIEILKVIDEELTKLPSVPKERVEIKIGPKIFATTPIRLEDVYLVFRRYEMGKILEGRDLIILALKRILNKIEECNGFEKFGFINIVDRLVSFLERSPFYNHLTRKANLERILSTYNPKYFSKKFMFIDSEPLVEYFKIDSLLLFDNSFIGKIGDYIFGTNFSRILRGQPEYFREIAITSILNLLEGRITAEINELIEKLRKKEIELNKLEIRILKKREPSEVTKKSLNDEIVECFENRYGRVRKGRVIKVIKTVGPERFLDAREVGKEDVDYDWYLERANQIKSLLGFQKSLFEWF